MMHVIASKYFRSIKVIDTLQSAALSIPRAPTGSRLYSPTTSAQ
jgi:hypothetical protein